MSAISLIVNVDNLATQRTQVYASSPRHATDRVSGWISFEDFSLYGSDPAEFRRLAARCNEAATAIEATVVDSAAMVAPSAAESPKTVGIL